MRSFRPHFRRKESFAAAEVRRKMQDKHQTKEKDYPLEEKLLEDTIGYHFKTPALLKEALTHSSYANELKTKNLSCICNERLEFFGDSILSIIVSEYLFERFEDLPEGSLTKLRASVVCEDALYKYASDIRLGDYLYLGHGEEQTNGRQRKSILADAFEALLAAMYLDSGKAEVQRFLMPFVKTDIENMKHTKTVDYKTLLQQIVQQQPTEMLEYVLVRESGPDHDKVFETEARLNSNVIGRGIGKSKRESEQLAAYEALRLFGENV